MPQNKINPEFVKKVEKFKRQFLYKSGALLRTVMKRQFKNKTARKPSEGGTDEMNAYRARLELNKMKAQPPVKLLNSSTVGSPPKVTKTSPLKNLIIFEVDMVKSNVKVGPKLLSSRDVPNLLDKGGSSSIYAHKDVYSMYRLDTVVINGQTRIGKISKNKRWFIQGNTSGKKKAIAEIHEFIKRGGGI